MEFANRFDEQEYLEWCDEVAKQRETEIFHEMLEDWSAEHEYYSQFTGD